MISPMTLARLKHPYLTQGTNYPKIKCHMTWYPLSIDESIHHPFGQCDFYIDKLTWYGKNLVMIRHNCLDHLGHGRDHTYDESIITKHNESMKNIGIVLAWIQHIRNEFGERCW